MTSESAYASPLTGLRYLFETVLRWRPAEPQSYRDLALVIARLAEKTQDTVLEANYYGSSAASLIGTVTLQADIYTNYGRPDEQHKAITLRLEDQEETVMVGEIKR